MKVTASDVLAASIDCCSNSLRDWNKNISQYQYIFNSLSDYFNYHMHLKKFAQHANSSFFNRNILAVLNFVSDPATDLQQRVILTHN
jgi:hypothetical protein